MWPVHGFTGDELNKQRCLCSRFFKKNTSNEWHPMEYLTIFYRDSHQKELKNDEEKPKAAPSYNQPIASKSSSKLPLTS